MPSSPEKLKSARKLHFLKLIADTQNALKALSDEDDETEREQKAKSKRKLPERRMVNQLEAVMADESLNFFDSGSELDEEEGFVSVGCDIDASPSQAFADDDRPIESHFSALTAYKAFEKERLLSTDVDKIDEVSEGVVHTASTSACNTRLEVEVEIVRDVDRDSSVQEMIGVKDEHISHEQTVTDYSFQWEENFATFRGQKEDYSRQAGPTISTTCPYELFTAVWDENVIDLMVRETNRYAWQTIAALSESEVGISRTSRLMKWKETDRDEIYRFLSIIIHMTLCYRARIDEYWTTNVLEMAKFRSLMSRDRFLLLTRFMHFVDNEISNHTLTSLEKKIAKISPIVEHCNKKFQELYVPKQYLNLDESLLLWKGRLSWVQCIRSRAARFGIKTFELCESDTGYLLKTLLYTGSGTAKSVCGFKNTTAKVVLAVSDGYLDVGHVLVMDNWYNQVSLTRYLKSRHTDVLGTLNRKQKNIPRVITSLNDNMRLGQMVSRHCGDISVVAWKDFKIETMISTYHSNDTRQSQRAGQPVTKPVVVCDCNKYMGGVDLKDHRLSMYPMERKTTTKWYTKVFRRLVNTSLMNTFLLYRANCSAASYAGQGRPLTHRAFRYSVADLLLNRHAQYLQGLIELRVQSEHVHRLDRATHTLVHTERAVSHGTNGSSRLKRRRCVRCSALGRHRSISTQCSRCNVGLCVGKCFEEYHTLVNLRKPVAN